ncbi:MAG TPA: anthranilate synthase component I family protein [Phycisphaerae bacterium]|nr:anthranilate synthase component I family protein [Phycisphaerae bacterium]HNU45820.1 anthranilate synthase component I family protein [Phycisphaerae bacterium]
MTDTARVVVEPLSVACAPAAAVVSFARGGDAAILESSCLDKSYGRFSVFCAEPVEVWQASRDGGASHPPDAFPGVVECPIAAFAERSQRLPDAVAPRGWSGFAGGWVGYLGYEAGLGFERLRSTARWEADVPLLRFGLCDAAGVYDHVAGQWYAVAVDWAGTRGPDRPAVGRRLADVRQRLREAQGYEDGPVARPVGRVGVRPNLSAEAYAAAVGRALEYIRAGDIYQVNLTQRFRAHTTETPLTIYRRLRQTNPATYGGLLLWQGGRRAVLSSSPELFLHVSGDRVVTRPIKGTRPRSGGADADARRRKELATSEKERAELNMIVDLLRNDLGRVCEFGTVRVLDPGCIEEWATVFHRVATIEGRLRPGTHWLDLLAATFPGGSITGAPKIRALQIIDELEPTARGPYCGALGYIGLDGALCLNVAIRTIVQVDSAVDIHAGGAIVAESTPQREYEEVLAKARGMFEAVGCTAPGAEVVPAWSASAQAEVPA